MKNKHTGKIVLAGTVGGLLAVGVALGWMKSQEIASLEAQAAAYEPPPPSVTTTRVETAMWAPSRTVPGFIKARQETQVTTDLPGLVSEVLFRSGQQVRQGEVLVRLDSRLEQTRLGAVQAGVRLAGAEAGRARDLFAKRAISRSDLEAAEAKETSSRAEAAELMQTIEKKEIRAPFDGVLGLRSIHPGRYLAEGDAVVHLVSVGDPLVEFSINPESREVLKPGAMVTLRTSGKGDAIAAEVTAVESMVSGGARLAAVEASIRGGEALAAGAFVRVDVPLEAERAWVTVPVTAIRQTAAGQSVFVVRAAAGDATPTVEERAIKTVGQVGDLRIVESGLADGETIVSSGSFKLSENQAVRVNNEVAIFAKANPQPSNN